MGGALGIILANYTQIIPKLRATEKTQGSA